MKSIPIYIVNSGYKAKAGPGHKPPIPHPKPNIAEPIINFKSTVLLVGTSNFVL